jgi:hypothetical protein
MFAMATKKLQNFEYSILDSISDFDCVLYYTNDGFGKLI